MSIRDLDQALGIQLHSVALDVWFPAVPTGKFVKWIEIKIIFRRVMIDFSEEFICFLSSVALAHTQKNLTQHLYIEGFHDFFNYFCKFYSFSITIFSVIGSQPWGIIPFSCLQHYKHLNFSLGCLITGYEFCETRDVVIYNISKSRCEIRASGSSHVLWLFRLLLIPFFAAINLPRMQCLLCCDGCLVESVLVPSACPFPAFVSSAVLLICKTLCSLLKWCKPLNKFGIFGWMQAWGLVWSLFIVLGCGHCLWGACSTEWTLSACKIIH